MSDSISAFYDDMDEYKSLCEQFGEKVQYKTNKWGHAYPDCYGKHADALKERYNKKFKCKRY